jgi:hypothetical protein
MMRSNVASAQSSPELKFAGGLLSPALCPPEQLLDASFLIAGCGCELKLCVAKASRASLADASSRAAPARGRRAALIAAALALQGLLVSV